MIILAPVFGPLTQSINMGLVHAGVMIVLALNIVEKYGPEGEAMMKAFLEAIDTASKYSKAHHIPPRLLCTRGGAGGSFFDLQ